MTYTSCEEWAEKLAMHIDQLSLADRAELEVHLRSCSGCSEARADWMRMGSLLHALPPPDFPVGLPSRLLQEMNASLTAQQVERHITYQLQYRKCGKLSCSTCRDGQGHGPYWYAYWREGSRLRSGYIGKRGPYMGKELPETGKTVVRELVLIVTNR